MSNAENTYKQAAWAALLGNGACLHGTPQRFTPEKIQLIGEWTTYVDADVKRTEACFDAIEQFGINWENTDEPTTDSCVGFADTFTDFTAWVLYGTIETGDGQKWPWAVRTGYCRVQHDAETNRVIDEEEEGPMGIADLLEILGDQPDIATAIARSRNRLSRVNPKRDAFAQNVAFGSKS